MTVPEAYVREETSWNRVRRAVSRGEYVALVGPKYCGKTLLLRDVLDALGATGSYACAYVDLDGLRVYRPRELFQEVARAIEEQVAAGGQQDLPLRPGEIETSLDFRHFLSHLLSATPYTVVVAVDHVESLPRYLAKALLRCFRVVYSERAVHPDYPRFVVVAAGALNLFQLTVSHVSPFNIATLVTIPDADLKQGREVIAEVARREDLHFSANAVKRILQAAGGDYYLIQHLCRQAAAQPAWVSPRVTERAVKGAIADMEASDPAGNPCMAERIRVVESDPGVLKTVLDVLAGQEVKRRELLTDIDSVELTGIMKLARHRYVVRSPICERVLRRYFTPRRVARLFSVYGRWTDAIHHFEQGDRALDKAERAEYLAAVVNQIYGEDDEHRAFQLIAEALVNGFHARQVVVYGADDDYRTLAPVASRGGPSPLQAPVPGGGLKRGPELPAPLRAPVPGGGPEQGPEPPAPLQAPVTGGGPEPAADLPGPRINLRKRSEHVESRAYFSDDFLLEEDEAGNRLLVFPLHSGGHLPTMGVVTLYNHVPVDRFAERREEVLEIAGFVAQTGRALAAARERRGLLRRERQRVQTLTGLSEVTKAITMIRELEELLNRIVERARGVLNADVVSLYLFDAHEQEFHTPVAAGLREVQAFRDLPLPRAAGRIAGHVVREREPLFFEDTARHPATPRTTFVRREAIQSVAGFPLLSADQPLGVLFVSYRSLHRFSPGECQIISAFADQAAIAIENARLFEETQRRVNELSGLHQVSQAIVAMTDVQELYAQLTGRIARFMGVAICGILLYDERREMLVPQSPFHGLQDEIVDRYRVSVDESSPAWLLWRESRYQLLNDVPNVPLVDELELREVATAAGMRDTMLVPMAVRGSRIGTIQVANKLDGSPFDEEDARLLSILANQAATAIENAQIHQRLAADHATLDSLYQLSTTLRDSLNPEDVQEAVPATLMQMFNLATCTIGLLDDAGERLDFVAHRGLEAPASRRVRDLPQDLWHVVRKEKRHVFVEDVAGHPGLGRVLVRQDLKSFAVLPLQGRERFLGIMTMGTTERLEIDEPDWDLILALANQAAVALENAQLHREVQEAHRALDDSLKVISHQLRAEPAFVSNTLSTMLAGKLGALDSRQRDRLEKAQRRLEQHHRMIDSLNLYDRLRGGRMEPRKQPLQVAEVIRALEPGYQREAERRGLTLETRLSKLPVVEADLSMVEIIAVNLVDNAVKFTPEGGRVCVETWAEADGIHLAVDDTGPGIPVEERTRVFDEYHQVESAHAEKGAGLGLYIARRLVEMHGGWIGVVDKEGPGARVEVVLPA